MGTQESTKQAALIGCFIALERLHPTMEMQKEFSFSMAFESTCAKSADLDARQTLDSQITDAFDSIDPFDERFHQHQLGILPRLRDARQAGSSCLAATRQSREMNALKRLPQPIDIPEDDIEGTPIASELIPPDLQHWLSAMRNKDPLRKSSRRSNLRAGSQPNSPILGRCLSAQALAKTKAHGIARCSKQSLG